MEYKNYYIINHGKEKHLILALSSQEAINAWIQKKQSEREEEGRKMKFNPANFSIEEITREDFLVKASE